ILLVVVIIILIVIIIMTMMMMIKKKESMSLNKNWSHHHHHLLLSFCDVLSSWVNHTLAGRVEIKGSENFLYQFIQYITTEILIYWAVSDPKIIFCIHALQKSEALSGLKCLEVRNNMFTSIGFLHAKILKYMWPYIKRYNNKKNEKEKINISKMNVDIEANISVRIKLGRFAP
ncbi:hypothetical protein ACJX0J_031144, partial [Zea mays]